MRKFFSVLCLALLVCSKANAATYFWYQDGSWTVWSEKKKCRASNRPIIETSHAPYMSFWFSYDPSNPGVSIDAYFWPGVFRVGDKQKVSLIPSGGKQVTVPAEAKLDFALRTDRPLTSEELTLLKEQNLLIVQPANTRFSLAVDAVKLPVILQQLEVCAEILERDLNK